LRFFFAPLDSELDRLDFLDFRFGASSELLLLFFFFFVFVFGNASDFGRDRFCFFAFAAFFTAADTSELDVLRFLFFFFGLGGSDELELLLFFADVLDFDECDPESAASAAEAAAGAAAGTLASVISTLASGFSTLASGFCFFTAI
jgi:hypothetical protein